MLQLRHLIVDHFRPRGNGQDGRLGVPAPGVGTPVSLPHKDHPRLRSLLRRDIHGAISRNVPGHPYEQGFDLKLIPGKPAWIPIQKKKTNNSLTFVPYFRYNRLFGAVFLVYQYTMFHAVRNLI